VNSVSGGRFQQITLLAPQDPEELGTDEPPDVSKSARDRPVHTRDLRDRDLREKVHAAPSGTEQVPIFIGRSGEPFPAGVEIMPRPGAGAAGEEGDDHDFCAILRWMLRAVGDALDVSRLGRDRLIYSRSPSI
jgi:hypothetical protein